MDGANGSNIVGLSNLLVSAPKNLMATIRIVNISGNKSSATVLSLLRTRSL